MTEQQYRISCDTQEFDLNAIHAFLSQTYWSPGVPIDVVQRAMENSLSFGVFQGKDQVGYARMVTDRATFAYLADVYILEKHRGKGLSKRLMQAIFSHPDLQGLRRMMLATRDAHRLYAQFGFTPLASPGRMMEITRPDIYTAQNLS